MSENKHTPEPWAIYPDDRPNMHWNNHIVSEANTNIAISFMAHDGTELNERGEANARRLVACVNACAGLETEMLEALVMDGTTLQNIMRRGLICLEQRDDLLKALEDIAWTRGLNERPSKLVEQLERKALIAIAKIKEAA